MKRVALASLVLVACGHRSAPPRDEPLGSGAGAHPPGPAVVGPGTPVDVVLTSPLMAPYWHPEVPGRVPVQLVRDDRFTIRPEFQLAGAPVRWIDRSERVPGQPAVEFSFELTDGLLTVTATYAVEGVAAQATFVPRTGGDGWDLTGPVRVVER